MTDWCTKDSHNETLLDSGNPSNYRLRPRKWGTYDTTKSTKRYSYGIAHTNPNPNTAPQNKNLCCQPCASDKTNGGSSGYANCGVATSSDGNAGKSAASNRYESVEQYKLQARCLSNFQRPDRFISWQDSKRLRGNFKEIPLGDGVHGQRSTPRSN